MSDGEQAKRSARGELGRDLIRYVPSQAIPAVIAFFTIPIVTRLFDPSDYGDYRLVLATVGAFGSAGSWMASSIYRFYPEMEVADRIGEFRTTIIRLFALTAAVLGTVWLVGLAVLQSFIRPDLTFLLLLGVVLMLSNSMWSVATALTRALRQVSWYSAGAVLNKALTLGGGVALVVLVGLGVDGLLWGNIAGTLFLLPILVVVVLRRLPSRSGDFDRTLGIDMLRYGYPITLMAIAQWMLQLSDRYVIAALRSSAEVGLYTAAYAVSEQALHVILLLFQMPFAVLGARVWEREGRDAAAAFVSGSARSYLLLAIPAWAGISVLADPIMAAMTDEAYREAAIIMPVVSGALVLHGIYWWFTSGATFMKKTGQLAVALIAGSAVNLALNLLLVGRFGYQIAAVTTFVSYGMALLVMARLSRRYFRWEFPVASSLRALLAAAVMVGGLAVLSRITSLAVGWELALGMPIGASIYGVALLALREPEARGLLRRVASRLPIGTR